MRKLFYVLCLTILLSGNALAADANAVDVTILAKSGSSWDERSLPEYAKGKPEITILRIRIPPGAQLALHKHLVINAGVLLSGELTVVTEDNKRLRLRAGDPIIEVVNTWHYGKNEGDTEADIIVVYAGATGVPITVNK